MTNYKLPPDLEQRLSVDPEIRKTVIGALNLYAWMTTNNEPMPPIVDDEETREDSDASFRSAAQISFIPRDTKVVSIYDLFKANRAYAKDGVKEKLLSVLKAAGVITSPVHSLSTGGRPRMILYFPAAWLPDADHEFAELEGRLFDSLVQLLLPEQSVSEASNPPAAEPENTIGPLRILRNHSCSGFGTSFLMLSAGQIIKDPLLCQHLLNTGAPVATLDDINAAACPECSHRFQIDTNPDRLVVVFPSDVTFYWNGVTVQKKRGQCEADYQLSRYALSQGVAIKANTDEWASCPKCQTVFTRVELLGDPLANAACKAAAAQIQAVPISAAPQPVAVSNTVYTPPAPAPMKDPLLQRHADVDLFGRRLDARFWVPTGTD